MADTEWADVSEFQTPVDDSYPHDFFAFRSNDGSHKDSHFAQNLAWANAAVASGKIFGYIVYYFYRPSVNGASVLRSMVGTPNPRMVVMIDVEGDGGKVSGNQSPTINGEYNALAAWLGDARRVIGYGNTSDLNTLWPDKPDGLRLIVAAYGSNPSYPGRFAHQYTDSGPCSPFDPCDHNSADGMGQPELEAMFGFTDATPTPTPSPITGEAMILTDPTSNGVWVVASKEGAVYAYDGAPTIGGTNNSAMNAGHYACVGIDAWKDPKGQWGFVQVLDWGDRGDGHSADGGDRFRRYHFARDGSNKVTSGTY